MSTDGKQKGTKLPTRCDVAYADALREISAFVLAAESVYGPTVATKAAEQWIEQVGNVGTTIDTQCPMWRHVTFAAALGLAKQELTYKQQQCQPEKLRVPDQTFTRMR